MTLLFVWYVYCPSSLTALTGASFVPGFADGKFATRVDGPTALVVGQDGTVYFADSNNQRLRKTSP